MCFVANLAILGKSLDVRLHGEGVANFTGDAQLPVSIFMIGADEWNRAMQNPEMLSSIRMVPARTLCLFISLTGGPKRSDKVQ